MHFFITKMLVLPDSRNIYKSFGTLSVCSHALIDSWQQDISQSQFFRKLVFFTKFLRSQTASDIFVNSWRDASLATKLFVPVKYTKNFYINWKCKVMCYMSHEKSAKTNLKAACAWISSDRNEFQFL